MIAVVIYGKTRSEDQIGITNMNYVDLFLGLSEQSGKKLNCFTKAGSHQIMLSHETWEATARQRKLGYTYNYEAELYAQLTVTG